MPVRTFGDLVDHILSGHNLAEDGIAPALRSGEQCG